MILADAAEAALAPFRHLPFAACVTRRRDGGYVAVTDGYASFAGLTVASILGRTAPDLFELVEPVGRQVFLADVDRHGRAHYPDARFRGPDGRIRHGTITVLPVHADDEPGLLVVVVDETSLWNAERGRSYADGRYAMLARHGRDLVTLHDARGTILWASPSARQVLGHDPDRLEGMPVLALIHPEDRRHAEEALRSMADQEPTFRLTVRLRSAEGSWRWLEVLGSPVGASDPVPDAALLLSSRDVTARVEAQTRAERLARSEARAHHEADAQRRLLDAVIEHAPSMIALLSGPESVLERANAAFLATVRRDAGAIGRPLHEILAPSEGHEGQEILRVVEGVRASGEPAQGRARVRVPGSPACAGTGHEIRHVEYRVQPVRDGDGASDRLSLHGIDVTEAVNAHEALGRSERDYRTLASFGFEMMRASDGESLFRIGLEGLSALIDAEFAALFDHVGTELRVRSIFGAFPPDVDPAVRRPQSPSAGLLGKAVALRQPVYTPDYGNDPGRDPLFDGSSLRGMLAVPVQHRGVVRHVMAFGASRPAWSLDEARLDVAASFGRRLEVALEAGAHLRDIESTREETFRVLGLALEHRDYETRGHTDRVVRLARRFATRLGLSEAARQELAWGAYLHDLGKLSISDGILLKPARLTPEEFREVERHTIIGEEIARGIAFLPEGTLAVIRSHHERWDGGGYPDGLVGERVPLLARIFSLVDVYDALTSERPYKVAWSVDAARAEMARDAGSKFDPELARVFLQVVEEMTAGLSPAASGPP